VINALVKAVRAILRGTHYWVHAALPSVFLLFGVVFGLTASVFDTVGEVCVNVDRLKSTAGTAALLPDPSLFWIGLGAVVVGRYFSWFIEPKEYARQNHESRAITQWALFGTLVVFAAFWFFEAMGTARVDIPGLGRAEAITYYIRCAIMLDKAEGSGGLVTILAVVIICGLAGHYLWASHPEPRAGTAASR